MSGTALAGAAAAGTADAAQHPDALPTQVTAERAPVRRTRIRVPQMLALAC
jgi:hypothetical protein